MKVALVGAGKTGSKVTELLGDNSPTIFDESNLPTLENLKGHDVIISFLPGPAFESYIELFLETKIPVVSGSTGVNWPKGIEQSIIDRNTCWIWASNFSLGMNLIHAMIKTLSKTSKLFDSYEFGIHEIHHTKKLDAPSGTALSWKDWLGEEAEITHERIGDVVGIHQLKLTTETEIIDLRHEARDRRIFAKGALWAANKVCSDSLTPGLYNFSDITLKELL